MKKIKVIFLLSLLTLTTQLPAYAFDEEAAVNAMAKDLAPLVTTLSRDVTVFHYNPLEKYGFSPQATTDELRSKEALAYVARKANSFWDEKLDYIQGNYQVGNGLYTARDPFQSLSVYGGDDFGLLTITLPKGTTFINIRKNNNKLAFSEETTNFAKEKCDLVNASKQELNISLKEKGCLDLFRKALGVLQVEAIVYSWEHSFIPWCKDVQNIAISLISSKQITPAYLHFYSKNLSSSSGFNPIYSYYKTALFSFWLSTDAIHQANRQTDGSAKFGTLTVRGFDNNSLSFHKAWENDMLRFEHGAPLVGSTSIEMKTLVERQAAYETWKVENLYACTDKYPEDKLPPYEVIPFKPYSLKQSQ